jgi:hypothetical protein
VVSLRRAALLAIALGRGARALPATSLNILASANEPNQSAWLVSMTSLRFHLCSDINPLSPTTDRKTAVNASQKDLSA